MPKRLFNYALLAIFSGSFLSGYLVGSEEAQRPDNIDRQVLSHIALVSRPDGHQLQFVCNRNLVAFRRFDDVGKPPAFDEGFEARKHWAVLRLGLRYTDWVIAGSTGALVNRLEWTKLTRVVFRPGTKKANRLVMMLTAGASGLYLGYLIGERDRPQCDDEAVLEKARDGKVWDRARSSIAFQMAGEMLSYQGRLRPDPDPQGLIKSISNPFPGVRTALPPSAKIAQLSRTNPPLSERGLSRIMFFIDREKSKRDAVNAADDNERVAFAIGFAALIVLGFALFIGWSELKFRRERRKSTPG